MTEYKMGVLVIFNQIPVLILDAAFLYGATYIEFYGFIWIAITGVVLLASVTSIIISSNRVFELSEDQLKIRVGKRLIKEYQLSDIKTIKQRKRSMEIGIAYKEKIKTIYLGWYISKYKNMKNQLMENIQKLDEYDRIIFVE
jgi:hypothetical protein